MLHAQDILGKYDDATATEISEAIDLDGPRTAPSEYLQRKPTPQAYNFEFDGLLWTTTPTTATMPTTTTTDPTSNAYQHAQPPEELLSHDDDIPTLQWQSSTTLPHPSQQMTVTTTPTPTPPPATPSHPIAPLIPIPQWTHPSSSHLATDDIWPTNLIDIIRAIKNMPPRQPTPPEFSFDLSLEAAERNYMVLMHKYNGSLAASLESQRDSTVGYGSEF